MSTRNFDASLLTKLRGDSTAAAFFFRQQQIQTTVQPGIGVNITNPQTGNFDSSNLTAVRVGNTPQTAQFFPTKITEMPCSCTLNPPTGADLSGNALVYNSYPYNIGS